MNTADLSTFVVLAAELGTKPGDWQMFNGRVFWWVMPPHRYIP